MNDIVVCGALPGNCKLRKRKVEMVVKVVQLYRVIRGSRVSDQISVTTYIRTTTPQQRQQQWSSLLRWRVARVKCYWSLPKLLELQQEMCHRPIIVYLGRVCQISVDRFSTIDKSAASCHNWGAVPSNLPLLNVQISDTSDIVDHVTTHAAVFSIIGLYKGQRTAEYKASPRLC